MNAHFTHDCTGSGLSISPALWFIIQQESLLLVDHDQQLQLPTGNSPPISSFKHLYSRCIGSLGNTLCMVIEVPANTEVEVLVPVSLRESYGLLGEELWAIAGRASQIVRWKNDHQFCGRCSARMHERLQELLRHCPQCGHLTYPRLSPAVIMSVVRGSSILLGRAPRFPKGMYSVLAGYVEPGETLEQAVAREVREEANIEVTDISYVGSQSWPFPHSLMVGFTARYAAGRLVPDSEELEDARWFSAGAMPRLPSRMSIARKLIEIFLQQQRDT